jgi:hypothetical protein
MICDSLRIWGSEVRILPGAPALSPVRWKRVGYSVGNGNSRSVLSRAFLFLAMRDACFGDPTASLDRRNNVVAERRLDA